MIIRFREAGATTWACEHCGAAQECRDADVAHIVNCPDPTRERRGIARRSAQMEALVDQLTAELERMYSMTPTLDQVISLLEYNVTDEPSIMEG